jgi:hypothetical protein
MMYNRIVTLVSKGDSDDDCVVGPNICALEAKFTSEFPCFTTASRPALGPTQPPIQWVLGALFLVVKRPGREADHSPPSSAEVRNAWSYTSTPQYVFKAWCLV